MANQIKSSLDHEKAKWYGWDSFDKKAHVGQAVFDQVPHSN